MAKGLKAEEAARKEKIAEQTYYRWRQKYGGSPPAMAKQLKALEKENARLKKMIAEQALDMEIRKGSCAGKLIKPPAVTANDQ